MRSMLTYWSNVKLDPRRALAPVCALFSTLAVATLCLVVVTGCAPAKKAEEAVEEVVEEKVEHTFQTYVPKPAGSFTVHVIVETPNTPQYIAPAPADHVASIYNYYHAAPAGRATIRRQTVYPKASKIPTIDERFELAWAKDGEAEKYFRLEQVDPTKGITLVSDGENRSLQIPADHEYSTQPAPSSYGDLTREPEWRLFGTKPPLMLAGVLDPDTWKRETEVGTLENLGFEKFIEFHSVKVVHLRVKREDEELHIWVTASATPIVLRMERVIPFYAPANRARFLQLKGRPADAVIKITEFYDYELPSAEPQSFFAVTAPEELRPTENFIYVRDQLGALQNGWIGRPAPELILKQASGPQFQLSSWRGRQHILLVFWASWVDLSGPQLHDLQEVYQDFLASDVAVRAINLQDTPQAAQDYLDQHQIQLDVVTDSNASSVKTFEIPSLPYVVLIDRYGIVRRIHAGWDPDFRQQLKTEIDALVARDRYMRERLLSLTATSTPDELVAAFAVDNNPVMEQAKKLLAAHGEKAIPILDDALRDPDPQVRACAIGCFGQIRPLTATLVEKVANGLADKDVQVRVEAQQTLVRLGSTAVPFVVKMLEHESPHARLASLELLRSLGPKARTALPNIVRHLSDADDSVRQMVIEVLPAFGRLSLPLLQAALVEEQADVHTQAAKALVRFQSLAIEPFTKAMATNKPHVMEQVAWAASVMPPKESSQLKEALRVQKGVAVMDKLDIPALIRNLGEKQEIVRERAARLLVEKGAEAIPDLENALKSPQDYTRLLAAWCLGEMGMTAEGSVDKLLEAISDPKYAVRLSVAKALGKLGPSVFPKIKERIDGSMNDKTLAALLLALGGLEAEAEQAAPILIGQLKASSGQVQAAAKEGLGMLGDSALPVLLTALESDDPEIQASIGEALGKCGAPAVEPLVALLTSPKPSVRLWAATALGKIGGEAESAIPALEIAANDSNNEVKFYAAEAIKLIKKGS